MLPSILFATILELSTQYVHFYTSFTKPQKKRVGRGPASGLGKTSGRGAKGQKARSGFNKPRGFEGGQTPHWKSARKYGFTNAEYDGSIPTHQRVDLPDAILWWT